MIKKLAVINDLHLGAKREGGTTAASAAALREYLLLRYQSLLDVTELDLLINGDLFDTFSIDLGDLLKAYDITCAWLEKTDRILLLSNGNHDIAKDSTKTSSFALFAGLLERAYPDKVKVINDPTVLPEYDACVIPHLINQETFDAAIEAVEPCSKLYLHCNYDNPFAVHSDHSLNLSEAQAKKLPVEFIIFGHEHQAKTALQGKVIIVGNQFPSSVADCLGNDKKFMLVGLTLMEVWAHAYATQGLLPVNFQEQDWQNLQNGPRFVRVTGKASAQQAGDVIAAIARFRATSDAFVITNAVEIAGLDDNESLSVSLEQIKAFSVMDALLEILTPEEGAVVKKLMENDRA